MKVEKSINTILKLHDHQVRNCCVKMSSNVFLHKL